MHSTPWSETAGAFCLGGPGLGLGDGRDSEFELAAASAAGVWYSTRSSSGAWALLANSPTQVRDVALAPGVLWAATERGVARWNGATWEATAPLPGLELIAALGDASAVAFSRSGDAAFRVGTALDVTRFPVPGVRLRRLRADSSALWAVGDFGAILRFSLVDGGIP